MNKLNKFIGIIDAIFSCKWPDLCVNLGMVDWEPL